MTPAQLFEQQIKDVGGWRAEKLSEFRDLVIKTIPNAELTWKWGSPVWVEKGMILSLGSFSDHIKIHFFKGASLTDSHKLFNAGLEAKLTRGIDIFEKDSLDTKALVELIKQAENLNLKK